MTRFFIDRPIVAIVISILMVLGGAAAIVSLPVEQYPGVTPPQIVINATYNGADPLAVEKAVATPIEQQMNGVENMIYMQSVNADDGTMALTVTFNVDSDINLDNVFTQNRLSQAEPFLPEEVRALGLTVRKSTAAPLLILAVHSPQGQYNGEFLANYGVINVVDDVARVPGVGQARVFGSANYAMRVWLQTAELARRGLAVSDVISALKAQNKVNPAGQLGAEPAPAGQQTTLTARTKGRLETPEEFGQIIVRVQPDGSTVRLSDVARISLGTEAYRQSARLNGKDAALIGVYQTPGSNALEVVKGVQEVVTRARTRLPAGIEIATTLDTSLPITAGIEEILHTLVEALILVILVVYLFLQSARATLIPLLAVPVSLVGAFLVFPMLGFSINTLSLFGLVLAIGLVVDDAIVVVEAVQHHMEHGLEPKEATIKAMKEVSGPVIGIGLILAAVFLPSAFTPGITGRMSRQFAITIAVSVLISAFNALSLSPALCALILKRPTASDKKGLLARFFGYFNRGFNATTNGYVRVTAGLVRKALLSLGIVALVALGSGMLGKAIPTSFVPDEDQGFFYVDATLPEGASLQRANALMKEVEEIVKSQPGVEFTNAIIGYSMRSQTSSTNTGFIFVSLKDWGDREGEGMDARGIIESLNKKLGALSAGRVFAFLPPAIPGLGTGGGLSMMLQDVKGTTPEALAAEVEKVLAAARKRPELAQVNSAYRAATPQAMLTVDEAQTLKQGVRLEDVYTSTQAFLGGTYVNDFNRFGRQWRVYAQAEPESRQAEESLGQLYVRGSNEQMVPLSALAHFEPVQGARYTNRFNLKRSAEITATPAPGFSSGQAITAMEEVTRATISADYDLAWNAMSYQEKAASGGAAGFVLAIVFVFLVLAGMYESWSLPWSVLLVTPVAVLGAFLGLLLRAFPQDVFSQVGLVMLVGLSAKNAILIVEFAVLKQKEGASITDAALTAAKLRLRPIIMTSFAFILGCVPLWIARGAGAVARRELGTVVIVGMGLATVLGVFLTPALFALVERMKRWRPSRARVPPPPTSTPASASVGGG